jgi:hypothetical protein
MPIFPKIMALSRHPITVLVLGTILSAIVVPVIMSDFTDHKLLQEAKLTEAKTILSQNTLVDKQLNTIQTMFENFVKDAQTSDWDYREIQKELIIDIHEQYKQFDEHAWWWYGDLLMQAKLLKIPNSAIDQIKPLIKQYEANLIESFLFSDAATGTLIPSATFNVNDTGYSWHVLRRASANPNSDLLA